VDPAGFEPATSTGNAGSDALLIFSKTKKAATEVSCLLTVDPAGFEPAISTDYAGSDALIKMPKQKKQLPK